MIFSKRSLEPEWIDLGPSYYTEEEYVNCLLQLDKIGRYLGGDRATFSTFKQLEKKPSSILDVGCGGGLFTIRLAKHFPSAQVLGIDLSTKAIEIANSHLRKQKIINVKFNTPATPQLDFSPGSFDIVTATLVCHHLPDEELIDFLKRAYQISNHAVIINDLHRSIWAYAGFACLAPLFFSNRLIFSDGLLSIKKGFIQSDWPLLLERAHIPLERCTLRWHWPFRWTLFITHLTHQG